MRTRVDSRNQPIKKSSSQQAVLEGRSGVSEVYSLGLATEEDDLEQWKEAESELLEPDVNRPNDVTIRTQPRRGLGSRHKPRVVRTRRRKMR